MLYLLYGPDSYRKKQRIDAMRDVYRKKNPWALGETLLDGTSSLSTFEDALVSGSGLFEEKRFLLVHDVFATHKEELLSVIDRHRLFDRPDLNIVLVEGELKESAALTQLIERSKVERFEMLSPARLRAWITAYVEKHKLADGPYGIAKDAVAKLATIGSDLWRLSSELEKLILFARKEELVTLKEVLMLVRFPQEEAVFALSDAFCEREALLALAATARLTADGGEPDGLISYSIGEARNLVRAHTAFIAGKTDGGEREFRMHPFVWKKRVAQARRWGQEEIDRLLENALQLDRAWKSGANKRLALDRFLLAST